ncbi:MAG: hypothetical protein AB7H97_11430 [Pseudobdellovibrionaceae bacterium]
MSEVLFVIKCLVVTLVIAALMQIRVGDFTIEEHAEEVVRHSFVTEYVQGTAAGVIVLGNSGWEKVKTLFRESTRSAKEGSENAGQKLKLQLKKGEEYLRDKAEEVTE